MGYSFLQSLGISEGIATNWEEYVGWAVKIGLDSDLRISIKHRLIQAKQPDSLAPLWNPAKLAKDLYGLFRELVDSKNQVSTTE